MVHDWGTGLRDKGLVTNNGEGVGNGRGDVKFYPYEKWGGGALLKGGGGRGTTSFEVVFYGSLKF